jgi:hypothetical protein
VIERLFVARVEKPLCVDERLHKVYGRAVVDASIFDPGVGGWGWGLSWIKATETVEEHFITNRQMVSLVNFLPGGTTVNSDRCIETLAFAKSV